jgi:hypothetical protein
MPSSRASAVTTEPSSIPKRLRSLAGTITAPRLPTFADSKGAPKKVPEPDIQSHVQGAADVADDCSACYVQDLPASSSGTPEQRREIARKAVLARWAKHKKNQPKPQ